MENANNTDTVDSFKRQFADSGQNFQALSPIPALKVHIRFLGKLEDTEVLWDATIQTLASHLQESELLSKPEKKARPHKSIQQSDKLSAFMQILAPHYGVSQIMVVLPVPMIDEPTIRKTIIMIRCYKRLKVGYHEFGGNL